MHRGALAQVRQGKVGRGLGEQNRTMGLSNLKATATAKLLVTACWARGEKGGGRGIVAAHCVQ